MMAAHSKDFAMIKDSLEAILDACILDKNDIKIKDLATFDVEYLFLQLRSKSIGEQIKLQFNHPDNLNRKGEACDCVTHINLNIAEIDVDRKPDHTNVIKLTPDGNIGIVMKYPTMSAANPYDKINYDDPNDPKNADAIFNVIIECMESIYEGENVYSIKTHPKEEVRQFLEQLTQEQFQKINDFFDGIPKLTKTIKYTCKGCGEEVEHKLEGLYNFFT